MKLSHFTFFFFLNQTGINSSNEKKSQKKSTFTEISFICSSSADLLMFQNNGVYCWQKSLNIATGDFDKSFPSPFPLKKLRQG